MGRYLVQHRVILVRFGQHGDELMVLRRGADQRRPADVDVLDTLIVRCTLRRRRLERIQIDRDQIDRRDTMRRHLRHVVGHVASAQDAAVDLRH